MSPGELFAEAFACTSGARLKVHVLAETPATVLFLEVRRLLDLCGAGCVCHSRMLRNLLTVLAGKNLYFYEKLTYLSQRTTREKLLSSLFCP